MGARALVRRLERRLGGGARRAHGARRDRHRHRRLAAHPLGALAAPRRSSPRAASSRCAASSRSRRASITPGRWRARSRTAHCSCQAMAGPDLGRPGSALAGDPPASLPRPRPARNRWRAFAWRSRPGPDRSRSTPTWPTASPGRSLPARQLGAVLRRAASARRRRSTSAPNTSTCSTRSCSSSTAASTTAASTTGRRCASGCEQAEARGTSAERYVDAQRAPRDDGGLRAVARGRADHRPCSSRRCPASRPLRGDGYDHAGSDYELISLTHYWDWTGFPVVALPAGVGLAQRAAGERLADRAGRLATGICSTPASSCRPRSACRIPTQRS